MEKADTQPINTRVWPYLIWPPVVLNVASVVVIGGMVAAQYARATSPESVQVNSGQIQIVAALLVFVVEWLFALNLIRQYHRAGQSIMQLFGPAGQLWQFNRWRALGLLIAYNGLFAIYIAYLLVQMPDLSYRTMALWQQVAFMLVFPATAAFTEELIWRGHILTGLMLRGSGYWRTILIAASSFALIHGVFFPEKLLATFVIGVLTGVYYLRERALLPLMITHWILDVWSFGLFLVR